MSTNAPHIPRQLPSQKAMKQFSKTAAERGEPPDPSEGVPQPRRRPATRPGDAGVGESDNQGSSPYADRSRPDAPQRDP